MTTIQGVGVARRSFKVGAMRASSITALVSEMSKLRLILHQFGIFKFGIRLSTIEIRNIRHSGSRFNNKRACFYTVNRINNGCVRL